LASANGKQQMDIVAVGRGKGKRGLGFKRQKNLYYLATGRRKKYIGHVGYLKIIIFVALNYSR